jgi:predicted HTH transcriptional regulator
VATLRQAVAYRGTEVIPPGDRLYDQIDAKDITGPLDQQVLAACHFVMKNMRVAARNEALTSLLAKCVVAEEDQVFTGRSTVMDKRGEGVQVILDSSERLSGQRPVYRMVDEAELVLVVPAARFDVSQEVAQG